MNELLYGLITGALFGFFLQKGRVLRYDNQLGALRFIDMTIVKFMFSAVLVGMVGVYLLKDFGLAKLAVKPTTLGGNIVGVAFLIELLGLQGRKHLSKWPTYSVLGYV